MRVVRARGALSVLAVGCVGLVAACGGSDGSDSDPLTADELRARANEICARYDQRVEGLGDPADEDHLLPLLRAAAALQKDQLGELTELTPPDELADGYDEALTLLAQAVGILDRLADEIESGADPRQAVQGLDDAQETEDRLDELARELGIDDCATGASEDGSRTATDASTTDASTTGASTTDGAAQATDVPAYLADVRTATRALTGFRAILRSVDSPDELQREAAAADAKADEFDDAIEQLDGYTLDVPRLEARRAALVASGDEVGSTLHEFAAAAAAGDFERLGAVTPRMNDALSRFRETAAASESGG